MSSPYLSEINPQCITGSLGSPGHTSSSLAGKSLADEGRLGHQTHTAPLSSAENGTKNVSCRSSKFAGGAICPVDVPNPTTTQASEKNSGSPIKIILGTNKQTDPDNEQKCDASSAFLTDKTPAQTKRSRPEPSLFFLKSLEGRSRARSLDKCEPIIDDISCALNKTPNRRERNHKPNLYWLEGDSIPTRTKVITRGHKPVSPAKKEQRELTNLLDQICKSEDNSADDEDEEFDFDKESQKCLDQLKQFRDAYVVDVPDRDLSPPKPSTAAEGRSQAGSDKEVEDTSILKKIAYFTSVAATTGFYFMMRKHHII